MRFLALLLLIAPLAQANTLIDSPQPKAIPQKRVADRKFWVVMGALAAAKTTDAITTERFLCTKNSYETNPIFGRHPSVGRFAGINAAYFSGEVGLAYGLKRFGRNHWWAKAWMIEPVFQAADHIFWAAHNEANRRKR